MKSKYIAVICGLLCLSCTDEDQSRNALIQAGYSDIEFESYAMFVCGEDDQFKTKFRAKNPQGMPVTGAVCCGILKGCTIRF